MIKNKANINSYWGYLIVEELIRNSITKFFISPGSRSTPLTIAAAANKAAKKTICFDERGAAYAALGYAHTAQKPAVLIGTSGTAAANYFPAVVEARNSMLPLILLTADRPPELRDSGANQTIDQVKIYGEYVNWFFDLPCPDEAISHEMLLSTVDQMVYRTLRSPAGPVHLNCMFREPLAPVPAKIKSEYIARVSDWQAQTKPFTQYSNTLHRPGIQEIENIKQLLSRTKNGLLLVGQLASSNHISAAKSLAEHLKWPVFADITSGLHRSSSNPYLINHFDLLMNTAAVRDLNPDLVLQIGRPLTSKKLSEYLSCLKDIEYMQVHDHPLRHDPLHAITHRFEWDIDAFCRWIMQNLPAGILRVKTKQLKNLDKKASSLIDTFLHKQNSISEISVARQISNEISPPFSLHLASSMPIRDMDMFAGFSSPDISVTANRGTSGIDGTLATAAGIALGSKKPVTVISGDLAFIHDINSLDLIKKCGKNLIIIVINNHGGGIFSFLPVKAFTEVFEPFFATPHKMTFENAALLFDMEYFAPGNNNELVSIYNQCVKKGSFAIIEVESDRDKNLKLHNHISEQIQKISGP